MLGDRLRELAERYALDPDCVRELQLLLNLQSQRSNETVPYLSGTFGDGSEGDEVPTADQGPAEDRLPRIGRYEDLGFLGRGGMGEVRRVRDPALNRVLALKILRPAHALSAADVLRFVEEAQITAQLRHPSIVPIFELDQLPDGRRYFTMELVRGQTMSDVIRRVHRASAGGPWRPAPDGWTFRRLIEAYRRLCEGVAYAHSRGVVHRDLKPANIMLGEFGEVRILDWGLAILRDAVRASESMPDTEPVQTHANRSGYSTRYSGVAGTPAYMSPEQAQGDYDRIDHRSDIYCLGAILYKILSGRPPYDGADHASVLHAVLTGPPPPIVRDAIGSSQATGPRQPRERAPLTPADPYVPQELREICTRAMAREPADRYASALTLAQYVGDWLEGLRRRDQAQALVREADQLMPEVEAMGRRAALLRDRAARELEPVQSWDAVSRKLPAWELEDEAQRLDRRARVREIRATRHLQAALSHAPDLPEAHERLAALYQRLHREAEQARDPMAAAQWETLLRAHDNGRFDEYLRGDGALTLVTDTPAQVTLYRYETRERRLVLRLERDLGLTPLIDQPVPMGSYLCVLRAPGRAEVRYPVFIGRQEHWHSCPPGQDEPEPVVLPRPDELGPDDCYVPAGWFRCGGDRAAEGSLPAQRVWLDSFVVRRHPVTHQELLSFLNALVQDGELDRAMQYAPKFEGHLLYELTSERVFRLREGNVQFPLMPRMPAIMVNWRAARAFARWESARTAQPWDLPGDLEWEKAARGVDGRRLPWGDWMDPTWCNMRDSFRERPYVAPVDAFPVDESPYGVRGLAGNVMDWCRDRYRMSGPPLDDQRVSAAWEQAQRDTTLDSTDATPRVTRGGHWFGVGQIAFAAHRYHMEPLFTGYLMGMRLARPLRGG